MIDAPDRPSPRFPEAAVARAIDEMRQIIAKLQANQADLCLTQGACGADLLFSECCLDAQVPVQWLQPFAEPEFIQRSVAVGGEKWQARYDEIRSRLDRPIRAMPTELGPQSGDPFELCNQWLVGSARAYGEQRLHMVCLWDGKPGSPGGTGHLLSLVTDPRVPRWRVDTRQLI